MKRVGVLALQGAFVEHIATLKELDAKAVEVRLPSDLDGVDALIIPGGESTTIGKLMADFRLLEPIQRLALDGMPVMGTCAGMILLSKRAIGLNRPTLDLMDVTIKRNAFGRQVDSFEADLAIPALGTDTFHAVFIRAPLIDDVGSGVEILASLPDGTGVAAQQGKLLATSFHPELAGDLRFHRYFLDMISNSGQRSK
jgi:5'-phosphate synthase pdxT subunit